MSVHNLEELALLNKKLEELFDRYNDLRLKNRDLTNENDILKRYIEERDIKIKDLEANTKGSRYQEHFWEKGRRGRMRKERLQNWCGK
jgi:hypothetical protein